jgi:potassium channel subfamily K
LPREVPQTLHDRNHLLIKVIKSVAQDHLKHQHDGQKPDYSFDDWEYIFSLMGTLDSLVIEDTSATDTDVPISENRGNIEDFGDKNGMIDWLHQENPLNITETLTEWMLLTLVEKLEQELLRVRRSVGYITEKFDTHETESSKENKATVDH